MNQGKPVWHQFDVLESLIWIKHPLRPKIQIDSFQELFFFLAEEIGRNKQSVFIPILLLNQNCEQLSSRSVECFKCKTASTADVISHVEEGLPGYHGHYLSYIVIISKSVLCFIATFSIFLLRAVKISCHPNDSNKRKSNFSQSIFWSIWSLDFKNQHVYFLVLIFKYLELLVSSFAFISCIII